MKNFIKKFIRKIRDKIKVIILFLGRHCFKCNENYGDYKCTLCQNTFH